MGRLLILLWIAVAACCEAEQRISVAAASDLNPAAQDLAAAFQRQTGVAVRVSYSSSGNIYSQIRAGAPYDVFLSADESYPAALAKAGLAGGATEYATGRLVLWVSHRAGGDVSRGLEALKDKRILKVSVANPAHAPYGKAAMAALGYFRLQEALRPKLVFGENVSQAAQFAESGNAQAALISKSMAMRPAMQASGRYVELPAQSYPPVRQAGVVTTRSRNASLARSFLEFLKSAAGREILRRHGFTTE